MKKALLLGMGLFSVTTFAQKVGINTNTPKETLEVNGSVQVKKLPNSGEENSVYQTPADTQRNAKFTPAKMVVADENGVLGQQELPRTFNADDVKRPFYYVEYELRNTRGDWVAWFDTKISADKYTVAVVGSTLEKLDGSSPYLVPAAGSNRFAPFNVNAARYVNVSENSDNQEVTWFLEADYPSASLDSGNGVWKIRCLVIDNVMVNIIPNVIQDMDGQATKTTTIVPQEFQ